MKIAAKSDKGLVRSNNQDSYAAGELPGNVAWAVVCDGMGGGPGGKTASYIVKNELMRVLGSCSPQMSRRQALQKAVALANDALYSKMEEFPQLKGMGSTLVAVLINEESALIVHLGDSRCYRVRGGRQVVFRTSDHSLVNELDRRGGTYFAPVECHYTGTGKHQQPYAGVR